MHPVLTRGVAAGLALLLVVSGAPARADGGAASRRLRGAPKAATQVRGLVTTPYVVLHPGTPREVTWFLGDRGPLATGEELTREEVRAFLQALEGGAPLSAVVSVAGKPGRGEALEAWEQQLWKDALADLGSTGVLVEAAREDLRPTAEDRRNLALRVALGRLLPAMAEEMGEAFRPEKILYAVGSAVVGYLAMWAIPEPVSKVAALGVTITMLVAFGAELLAHVVAEWKALVVATAAARSFAEVKVAGERFGRAVGEDGARVLFVLASLAMGKDLHGILKRLPRAPPSGPAMVAELPGGMRVRLPALKPPSGTAGVVTAVDGGKVVSVTVVGDRFVVAMAAGAGGAAGVGLSGGSGAAPVSGSPTPSSKRLAANLEAAGVPRPPGTDAHHIVAANAEAAGPARAVLRRFGVDIDDAANGVFLPSNSKVVSSAPGPAHSTIHTKEYYDLINNSVMRATNQKQALAILEELRQILLSGMFP